MTPVESTIASEGIRFGVGDVVEVITKGGLVYLQVTHLHPAYPEVVRVLGGLHETRPDDLKLVVSLPTRFHVITPLAAGISGGRLSGEFVGRFAVPDSDRAFPRFRTPIRDRNGVIVYWWLWDGETLSHVTVGDVSASALPVREVVGFDALLKRLVDEL